MKANNENVSLEQLVEMVKALQKENERLRMEAYVDKARTNDTFAFFNSDNTWHSHGGNFYTRSLHAGSAIHSDFFNKPSAVPK